MIRIVAVNKEFQLVKDSPLSDVKSNRHLWYWIDFKHPTEAEIEKLRNPFRFHPLAIEDCIHKLQRPKLDYYEDYTFFVTHSIHPENMEKEEVNVFVGENYIVTFHQHACQEIEETWNRFYLSDSLEKWDQYLVLYQILDELVDNYFPILYEIEETLAGIEDNSKNKSMEALLENLFDTRHNLLSLRNSVAPMRDLIYRMISSHRLTAIKEKQEYFSDIYDHLLKLTEMIESNRELTSDIRDSYLSLNSHQTNRVMKVLTVITTIFMPLTFIAGIYGMNFKRMPELTWKYGYYAALSLMLAIGLGMFLWFKKKGWFK